MDFVIELLCADIDTNTGIDPDFDDVDQAIWSVHVFDEKGNLMELEYSALGESISFCYLKDETNQHFFEAEELIRSYLRSSIYARYIIDGKLWVVKRFGNDVMMCRPIRNRPTECVCYEKCIVCTKEEFKAMNPIVEL